MFLADRPFRRTAAIELMLPLFAEEDRRAVVFGTGRSLRGLAPAGASLPRLRAHGSVTEASGGDSNCHRKTRCEASAHHQKSTCAPILNIRGESTCDGRSNCGPKVVQ